MKVGIGAVLTALLAAGPALAQAESWPSDLRYSDKFFNEERSRSGKLVLCGQALDADLDRAKAAAFARVRARVIERRTQVLAGALKGFDGSIATDPAAAAKVEQLDDDSVVVERLGGRFRVSVRAGYPEGWVFSPHQRLLALLDEWPEDAAQRTAWFNRAANAVEQYEAEGEVALAGFTALQASSKPGAPGRLWIKAADLQEQHGRPERARDLLKRALDRTGQPPAEVLELAMRLATSHEQAGRRAGGARVVEGLRAASRTLQEVLPALPAEFGDRSRVITKIVEVQLELSKTLEQQGEAGGGAKLVEGLEASCRVLVELLALAPAAERPRILARVIDAHLRLSKLHDDQGEAAGKQADGLERARRVLTGLLPSLPAGLADRRRVEVRLGELDARIKALEASWDKLVQELQAWVKARGQPRAAFHVTHQLRGRKLELQAHGAEGRTVAWLWLDQDGLYRYHVLAPDQRGVLMTPELAPGAQAYIVAVALPAGAKPAWLTGPEEIAAKRKVDAKELPAVDAFRAVLAGDQLWAVGFDVQAP
jgi:tetratricopeptide (TPR) repeat protein